MAPERIEGTLKKAAVVQQVFVHGNSFESCVVAVVVPDEKALRYGPLSSASWWLPCGQALPEEATCIDRPQCDNVHGISWYGASPLAVSPYMACCMRRRIWRSC